MSAMRSQEYAELLGVLEAEIATWLEARGAGGLGTAGIGSR
jgi:hypothetical protein